MCSVWGAKEIYIKFRLISVSMEFIKDPFLSRHFLTSPTLVPSRIRVFYWAYLGNSPVSRIAYCWWSAWLRDWRACWNVTQHRHFFVRFFYHTLLRGSVKGEVTGAESNRFSQDHSDVQWNKKQTDFHKVLGLLSRRSIPQAKTQIHSIKIGKSNTARLKHAMFL